MINSQFDNPVQWLEYVAMQIGATVENNSLILNGSAEEGLIGLFPLEKGLIMILTEVDSNLGIRKLMPYVPADYLFMKLYLPDHHLTTTVKSEFDYYQVASPGVLLYNSHLKLSSLFNDKKRFKIVSFAIHTDWLTQTFPSDSIFSEKQLFEGPFFRFQNTTPAILQSALNLFTLITDPNPGRLRMKAIAFDMLSQLFSAFDLHSHAALSFKNQNDIQTIFKIRERLLNTTEMSYPTVDVLAKQAAMSPSKLKTLFRSVFGMSVFEFYQHHRLDYSRHLIEERKLSIGEIGLKIGYSNLSKFSQAYKKRFGYLPHETL